MYQAEPKTSNRPSRSSTGARPGWSWKYWATRWGLMPCCGKRLPRIEAAASTTSRIRAVRMERNSRQAWMVLEVLGDPLGADALLREEAAEDRGGGQHDQQDQGGPHGAELAPGLAQRLTGRGPPAAPLAAL